MQMFKIAMPQAACKDILRQICIGIMGRGDNFPPHYLLAIHEGDLSFFVRKIINNHNAENRRWQIKPTRDGRFYTLRDADMVMRKLEILNAMGRGYALAKGNEGVYCDFKIVKIYGIEGKEKGND